MNVSDASEIRLKNASSKIIEPGIIYNEFKEGVDLEVDDLIGVKKANLELANGRPYTVLLSFGYLTNTTSELREMAASKEFVMDTLAIGLLTHSTGQRLMGNFYLNFNKPKINTRLFTSEDKACEWLRNILAEKNAMSLWK